MLLKRVPTNVSSGIFQNFSKVALPGKFRCILNEGLIEDIRIVLLYVKYTALYTNTLQCLI